MDIKRLFKSKKESDESLSTVFHITHYKSGSQWVLAVLNEVAKNRIVEPQVAANHVTQQPIIPGRIYPCVYLTKPKFLAANPPENRKVFIVLRDLRDTLVSLYFSVRNRFSLYFFKITEAFTSRVACFLVETSRRKLPSW